MIPTSEAATAVATLIKERDEARAAATRYMEDGATILRKTKETLDGLKAELDRVRKNLASERVEAARERDHVDAYRNELKQAAGELERVTAERDASRLINEEDSADQVLIERMCASVLGQAVVDGDSYGVPGPLECVRMAIEKLEKQRDEARAEWAKLKEAYFDRGWDVIVKERDDAQAELERAKEERDGARAALDTTTRHRNTLSAQVVALRDERDAANADVARLTRKLGSQSATKTGAKLIADERQRQREKEGWTDDHDDKHDCRELARAANCYLAHYIASHWGKPPRTWPWDACWWKPKSPMKDLIRGGALVAAEIDRLIRAGEIGQL